jgi:hypothetical protein
MGIGGLLAATDRRYLAEARQDQDQSGYAKA